MATIDKEKIANAMVQKSVAEDWWYKYESSISGILGYRFFEFKDVGLQGSTKDEKDYNFNIVIPDTDDLMGQVKSDFGGANVFSTRDLLVRINNDGPNYINDFVFYDKGGMNKELFKGYSIKYDTNTWTIEGMKQLLISLYYHSDF